MNENNNPHKPYWSMRIIISFFREGGKIMLRKKWVYYGMLIAAITVFLLSGLRLVGYFADGHQSIKQMKEARALYYDKSTSNLQVPKLQDDESSANTLPIKTKTQDNLSPIYSPAPFSDSTSLNQTSLQIQDRFKPLFKINADVIGWIHIDDTLIDYPVLQTNNNEYYLSKDLYRKDNVNGSIFMDDQNRINAKEKHWILYGHNMKDKSMFMALLNYESKWFFDHHPIIDFDTLYENKKWRVFSAYYTDITDNYLRTDFKNKEEYTAFITAFQNKSLHPTNVTLNENNTILTLSTCSNTNDEARFVVHAQLIPSSESMSLKSS
jgi:sortase B